MSKQVLLLSAILCLFSVSTHVNAGLSDWLDMGATILNDAIQAIKQNRKSEEQAGNPGDSRVLSIPENWRASTVTEPVFNSRIQLVEAGLENKPVILLIHGLGQNGHRDWYSLIPELEKSYHVIALDLPGFGFSEKPEVKYSPEKYALMLEWLVSEHYQLDSVHVAGHSMGGAVALYFAGKHKALVDKLLLVDVAGVLQRGAFVKSLAQPGFELKQLPSLIEKPVTSLLGYLKNLIETINLIDDPAAEALEKEDNWNISLAKSPNLNAAMGLIETDFSGIIPAIKAETTIIWGEKDPVAPLRTAWVLRHLMANSHLHVIGNAGHVPMKTHTEIFNRLFIDALVKAGADTSKNSQPVLRQFPATHYITEIYNQEFEGAFEKLVISNSKNILIKQSSVRQLVLINSSVELLDTNVDSTELCVDAVNSVLVMTAVDMTCNQLFKLTNSRLDIAGSNMNYSGRAAHVVSSSRMIASVSQLMNSLTKEKHYLHHARELEAGAGLLQSTIDK